MHLVAATISTVDYLKRTFLASLLMKRVATFLGREGGGVTLNILSRRCVSPHLDKKS